MSKNDAFGNRMKAYEATGTVQRLIPDLPVVARIDGRAFHTFCKSNFDAGYSVMFNNVMKATTEYLVRETNALIGYTQSDEITLIWNNEYNSPMLFSGKVFKLTSVLASMATAIFNRLMPSYVSDIAHFDCRIWNVPDKEEACNVLLWREKDATRNSIFSLANTFYSHNELNNKTSSELQEMIFQKGTNWNDCSSHQKRGTYIRMEKVKSKYTPKEIADLPPLHNARFDLDIEIERREVRYVKMPPFSRVSNKVDVVFNGEKPISVHKQQSNSCLCKECVC